MVIMSFVLALSHMFSWPSSFAFGIVNFNHLLRHTCHDPRKAFAACALNQQYQSQHTIGAPHNCSYNPDQPSKHLMWGLAHVHPTGPTPQNPNPHTNTYNSR